jgi:Ca2+-binding EF-hand superfamily protein
VPTIILARRNSISIVTTTTKTATLKQTKCPTTIQQQFKSWDINQDAKVFIKEIEESFALAQLPLRTQVRATVSNQGNSLFKTLDLSGDNRLSLREIKTAEKQILAFGTNKDGTIKALEIPQTISVLFSRGNPVIAYRPGQSTAARNRPTNSNPAWFTRMDRNGDGDITLKEFLGEKAQFAKLDKNSDGFNEPAEAKQAK